jgi:FdhD protein
MTMRTPGDDLDLAAGFLVSEGIVRSPGDIAMIRLCDGTSCGHAGHEGTGNIVDVDLRPGLAVTQAARRNFMTTSACGVCGKASTAELFVEKSWDINEDHASVSAGWLASAPDALRAAQRVFASTGGLHAAGVFGADGELVVVREDVGRHNAVDKVVGWALRQGRLPLRGCVLLVSGRASFELAQKAVLAGFPVLAAVSAPSSLAVDLAAEAGLTLVGFLRGESMNVYTRADRIALPD